MWWTRRAALRSSLMILFLAGCTHHKVDTFPKWCKETHQHWWNTLFSSVSFDTAAIRDDYVKFVNEALVKKVQNRAQRMAWRDGTQLHMMNLSTLLEIEPDEVIRGWQHGIEAANTGSLTNLADRCVFGAAALLFDSVYIHSRELKLPVPGNPWKDSVTVIPANPRVQKE